MLRLLTGRNHMLGNALAREAARALSSTERSVMVVVPRQLTLETELMLLDALALEGSFRLRVLSPERLCQLIFDAAGYPEGARIDERGRALLLSGALKDLRDDLTLYRGARARRGFVPRAAKQIEAFRQAGVEPEELSRAAERATGALSRKLHDLSAMLRAYTDALEGRFQDGEAEFRMAAERAQDAAFLSDALLFFYGFDLMPPTMHALIAALCARSEVAVLLPLESDAHAPDWDLFRPLSISADRLVEQARAQNAIVRREPVEGDDLRAEELRYLGRALLAYPIRPYPETPRHTQLLEARNPREEARFAASLARRLVRTRGWRYNDVRVLVPNLDAYRQPLREAFAACGIPLFLSESRPASRHALVECVLTALNMIARGFRQDDLFAYLSTGYPDIGFDEADRLKNYAVAQGLRPHAFFKPLKRGPDALVQALEPVRARAAAPLAKLRDALRAADGLRAQLSAVYGFLEDLSAYEKGLARQKALADAGMFEQAGEEAQVWNRLLGALDQMAALLPGKKLPVAEVAELLSESLDASVVKPLPQSGDAVYAVDLSRLSMRRVKAVLVLGQVDRAVGATDALLTDRQLEALSHSVEKYVGQTAADAARSRLFYIKAGIEMATDYALISYPLSGIEDTAERPGPIVSQLRQIFPDMRARGGILGDAGTEALRFEAPGAALRQIALSLSAGAPSEEERRALAALSGIARARAALGNLAGALDLRAAADALNPDTARRIYDGLKRASISRLETFAACPFKHFMRYGMEPELTEPYALTPRDEGVFFHGAVRGFLSGALDGGALDPERAEMQMDQVADALLAPLRDGPLGQSAVSRAEEKRLRAVARTAARLIAEQLDGSRFRPVGLELRFGERDGDRALLVGAEGDCALYGTIDRVDEWDEGDKYLRVLDYKRGARAFSLAEAYAGLQLQLLIYLAAAAKKRGGTPAGAFYFRLDDGYVATGEVDPERVKAARLKELRLEGLFPDEAFLREAMSPDPARFLKLGSTAKSMGPKALSEWTERALHMAGRHVDAIRAGEAAPSPARVGNSDACEYCDWRRACMFDPALDRDRVRKVDAKARGTIENVTID